MNKEKIKIFEQKKNKIGLLIPTIFFLFAGIVLIFGLINFFNSNQIYSTLFLLSVFLFCGGFLIFNTEKQIQDLIIYDTGLKYKENYYDFNELEELLLVMGNLDSRKGFNSRNYFQFKVKNNEKKFRQRLTVQQGIFLEKKFREHDLEKIIEIQRGLLFDSTNFIKTVVEK